MSSKDRGMSGSWYGEEPDPKGHDEDGHMGVGHGHEEHGQGHGYGHDHDGDDGHEHGPGERTGAKRDARDDDGNGKDDGGRGHDGGHGRGHKEHGEGHGRGHDKHADDDDDEPTCDPDPVDCDNGETLIGSSGDDVLEGTDCDDVIFGGAGDDVLQGRAGDDLLIGGSGSDTIFGGEGDDTIFGGGGGAASHTITVTLQEPEALYDNSLGFYVIDPVTGEFSSVQMAFEDTSGDGGAIGTSYTFSVPPGAQVGSFMVAHGDARNDYDALGEGEFRFVNSDGDPASPGDDGVHLVHVATDGTETQIDGNVYHSMASGDLVDLNPDGEVHIQGIADNGDGSYQFGFEDITGLGDADFDDVVFTVDIGDTGATFLNPDFDARGGWPSGDPHSSNELHGGDGDDVIVTGAGSDEASGGAGDDTFFATPGDSVDGGDGYDTLVVPGQLNNIENIEITNEVVNDDGTVSRDGYIDFADGSPRLDFVSIENIIPCFTPGTSIATPTGERLVETLREGDKIITRDNGIQEIRWIGQRVMDWKGLAASPHLKPILIERGALGNGLPERDMMVSPQHRLLVANERTALYFDEHEVLVASKHLLNHKGVREVDSLGVSYVHFMCDRHEVVLSNGAWSETFQPGDYTLKGMGNAQRLELFELFPDLKSDEGREAYGAARKTLKRHEARLLAS